MKGGAHFAFPSHHELGWLRACTENASYELSASGQSHKSMQVKLVEFL